MPLKKFAISDMPPSVTYVGPTCHWDINNIYGITENCNGIWEIVPLRKRQKIICPAEVVSFPHLCHPYIREVSKSNLCSITPQAKNPSARGMSCYVASFLLQRFCVRCLTFVVWASRKKCIYIYVPLLLSTQDWQGSGSVLELNQIRWFPQCSSHLKYTS
jgi:hypothetical protein